MFKILKTKILLIVALIISVILIVSANLIFQQYSQKKTQQTKIATQSAVPVEINIINYQGEDGVDALTLLEKHAQVEKTEKGMVLSINGRKADQNKKEFWAFYVNKTQAPVGAADYKTQSSDVIEWRLENY